MMKQNNKNFDILTMSEQNAVKAGNGVIGTVEPPAPMVKDSSVTLA